MFLTDVTLLTLCGRGLGVHHVSALLVTYSTGISAEFGLFTAPSHLTPFPKVAQHSHCFSFPKRVKEGRLRNIRELNRGKALPAVDPLRVQPRALTG